MCLCIQLRQRFGEETVQTDVTPHMIKKNDTPQRNGKPFFLFISNSETEKSILSKHASLHYSGSLPEDRDYRAGCSPPHSYLEKQEHWYLPSSIPYPSSFLTSWACLLGYVLFYYPLADHPHRNPRWKKNLPEHYCLSWGFKAKSKGYIKWET